MIKNYEQFINEDIKSKNITLDVNCNNLKRLYPDIQLKYNDDLKIGITVTKNTPLNKKFYDALENDHIKKEDIAFENCEEIELFNVDGFTKISDYGVFGENIKNFSCYRCKNLTSLEGAPETVIGNFSCTGCVNLTSLEGAPKTVGGNFDCDECENITSLDGAPEKVGGDFRCNECYDLTTLDGAPENVDGDFRCNLCYNLTSLDGAHKTVNGDFYCIGCNPDFIKLAKAKYGSKVRS